jgi:hypothetical protein
MWLVVEIAMVIFTYFSQLLTLHHLAHPYAAVTPQQMVLAWKRHDADWYLAIAQYGYTRPEQTAFFPLYPLLIKLCSPFTFFNWPLAALLVSNLALLGAFCALALLAVHEQPNEPRASAATIRALIAYPLAFFFFAPYTESVFLLLAVLALLAARRGWWRAAPFAAFLAGLTRPVGIVLILPLLVEFGSQRGWWRRPWRIPPLLGPNGLLAALPTLLAVPAAVAVYAGYCALRFGNPLEFGSVETFWGRSFEAPWRVARLLGGVLWRIPAGTYNQARLLVDAGPLLLILGLTVLCCLPRFGAGGFSRRLPLVYILYMAGLIAISTLSPVQGPEGGLFPFASVGRYLAVSFPIFLALGRWSNRSVWIEYAVGYGGTMLMALFAGFYLVGGWII